MAMQIGGSRRSSRRRGPVAEINVTPFVDVMLVLLVVFMITAPMLTTGVPVDLPRTKAQTLPSTQHQPLVVSVDKDGKVYVGTQDEPVEPKALAPMLKAIAKENLEERVFIRGDEKADYGVVVGVLALIQGAGFTKASIVTDDKAASKLLEGG